MERRRINSLQPCFLPGSQQIGQRKLVVDFIGRVRIQHNVNFSLGRLKPLQ